MNIPRLLAYFCLFAVVGRASPYGAVAQPAVYTTGAIALVDSEHGVRELGRT